MKTLDDIRKIRERHRDEIFNVPGVTGVGVGFLSGPGGQLTEDVGIIVYHEPAEYTQGAVPREIEGVKVEMQPGSFTHHMLERLRQEEYKEVPDGAVIEDVTDDDDNPRNKKIEPMVGGIGGNPDFFYWSPWIGTIGLVVRDGSGNPMIMSNRHVICGKKPAVGDGVSQPARNVLGDLAASLVNWELGNVNVGGTQYGMDAAVAKPTNGRTATIGGMYGSTPALTGSANAALGMNVMKSGLTTDITLGTVTRIDVDVKNGDQVAMNKQVVVKAPSGNFSESGDSGSAVVDTSNNRVVALLWGSNSTTNETVASPIIPILTHFSCSI